MPLVTHNQAGILRGRRTILLSILLALAWAAPMAGARTIVQPVPLQKDDCAESPGDTEFTGHALFSYRIEADGAVREIKLLYADVQPGARQSSYLAEVTRCLEQWRYRPATVDGTPAPATMNVAFHRFPPARGGEEQVALPGGRVVPVSLLKQVRAATLTFMDSLLKGQDYKESKGHGWFVRTDLPKSALDDVQAAIEFARRVFDEAFPGPGVPAGAQDVTVILFKDEKDFQHLSAFDNFIPNRAPLAGQYDPEFRMIYSTLGPQPMPFFARTVAHEATHHFAAQRLSDADGRIPRWLDEGIAQYVECTRMAKPGKVRLEALDRGMTEQPAVVMARAEALSGAYVYPKRVERALLNLQENLSGVDIAELVDGRHEERFFVEGAVTLYDVSWLLVHYLMNGDERQHREAFRKWVAEVGVPRNSRSLAAAMGIPAEDLPARLSAHLARIR
ncbi:MAG TPA: DUF1570 domain-containing protein [Candidatus Polarisedimenticolia bacterium]|nr:DUF1570 domain-containing protein [Candidatus Polarisedimenticolia bacterium]